MKKFLITIIFLLLFVTITPINTSTNTQTTSVYANKLTENKNDADNKNNSNKEVKKENNITSNTENEHKKENNVTNNNSTDNEAKKESSKSAQASAKQNSAQNNNSIIKTDNTNYGTFGRLYVSNYSVALYDFNVNTQSNSSLQRIVDNKDSAAYYLNNGKLVIADHYYQGFSVLASLNENTTSYIKFKSGKTINYKLIKKSKGFNNGLDLVDTKGNSFFEMDADIIMYTCYENGIMATLWKLA